MNGLSTELANTADLIVPSVADTGSREQGCNVASLVSTPTVGG